MDIYWIKDRKKCGPATVPDVVSMVQSGDLSPETPGWHSGCEGWIPLRELPALADFLNPRDAADKQPEVEPEESTPPSDTAEELPPVPSADEASQPEDAGNTLHVKLYAPGAGVRLLARLVDMTLYTTLVYTLVYIFQIAYTPYLLPGSPMFWLGMIVLEAFCLRIFGTTPGKKLLHIYVVELSADGLSGVSPMRAFARSFMVFVGGLGMMISFLPLIMGGISLYMLWKRGITSWDARTETHPVQVMRPHGARFLLAVVILFSCLQMISLLFQPWFGPIIQDMERYAPEQAAMLRSFLPQEAVPSPAPVQAEPSATEGGLRFLEL